MKMLEAPKPCVKSHTHNLVSYAAVLLAGEKGFFRQQLNKWSLATRAPVYWPITNGLTDRPPCR